MKKILLILIILASINLYSAPDKGGHWKQMPPTLQGRWVYRLYGIEENPMPIRVQATRLLTAYSDRVEIDSEILYVKDIVVTENGYIQAWITISFKDREDFVIRIRHMKEADAITAFFVNDGKTSSYYHFNCYGKTGRRGGK